MVWNPPKAGYVGFVVGDSVYVLDKDDIPISKRTVKHVPTTNRYYDPSVPVTLSDGSKWHQHGHRWDDPHSEDHIVRGHPGFYRIGQPVGKTDAT